jgi:hypothetical protein
MNGGILNLGLRAVKARAMSLASILNRLKNALCVKHYWACSGHIWRNIPDSESPSANSIE